MTKADRLLLNQFKVVRHARHGNEQAASVYGESLHLSQIVTLHPMNGDAAFKKAIAQDAAEVAATQPKSFAVEVIADNSGKFCGNGCRYKTRPAAEDAARDLMSRWILVREWRVVESEDEPNR